MLAVASALIRWGILQTCTQGVGSLTRRQSVFSGLSSSLMIPKNLALDIYASEGLKKREAILLLLPSAIGWRFQWNPCSTYTWYLIHNNLGYSLNQIKEYSSAIPYIRT